MTKIGKRKLKEMEQFFLKELFDGIPAVEVEFADTVSERNARGVFLLRENDDYYRGDDGLEDYHLKHYMDMSKEYGFAVGYNEDDDYWRDPLNRPEIKIQIDKNLQKDPVQLVMTLLHELCHYYCWYLGFDDGDEDEDFIRECHKRGIASNYDYVWVNKQWVRPDEYRHAGKVYIEKFLGRAAA